LEKQKDAFATGIPFWEALFGISLTYRGKSLKRETRESFLPNALPLQEISQARF